MQKHYIIRIHGLVQGVFFRASTQDKANQLGIKGFVRNEPDRTVYIEAEGEENNLNDFINWCWKGPSGAKVEKVEYEEGDWKNFERFEVR